MQRRHRLAVHRDAELIRLFRIRIPAAAAEHRRAVASIIALALSAVDRSAAVTDSANCSLSFSKQNSLSHPWRTSRVSTMSRVIDSGPHDSTRCCACGGGEHLGHHGSSARVDDRS